MTEPNDCTPLDFTRALELVCDGTEVFVSTPARNKHEDYLIRRKDGMRFTNKQHPLDMQSYSMSIAADGRSACHSTGPQIVCNRVEEGWLEQSFQQSGRDYSQVPVSTQSRSTVGLSTPAAPEPDGEVVADLADHLGHEAAAIASPLPTRQAEPFAELRRVVERVQVGTLTVDVSTLKALLALTPPPPSSATPAEGMVAMLREARGYLEADRLIEAGKAMRGEVSRCPVRQLCGKIDAAIRAKSGSAGNVG